MARELGYALFKTEKILKIEKNSFHCLLNTNTILEHSVCNGCWPSHIWARGASHLPE